MLKNNLISDFIYSIQVSNFEDMFDQWPWPGLARSKQGMDPYQPISRHDQYVLLLPPSVYQLAWQFISDTSTVQHWLHWTSTYS